VRLCLHPCAHSCQWAAAAQAGAGALSPSRSLVPIGLGRQCSCAIMAWEMDRRFLLALVAAVIFAACGSGPSPPPSPSPPVDPGPQRITGTERLAWTQVVSDAAELSLLRYAAYVDGTRSELRDSVCVVGLAETAFECSSGLPPMSPGLHTIQ
jgi:hypothetical protein